MTTIKEVFNNKAAFIAYLTAGQKDLNISLENALSLIKGGVDILEIGVPFSDPVADGSVIQKAMNDALMAKTQMKDVFTLIRKIKEQKNVPIVLFSYYNPIFKHLNNDFYKKAKDAGVDGILIIDLPLQEATEHIKNCYKYAIDPIFVIAPSTTTERIKTIAEYAKGFIYYACQKGTTGMKKSLPEDFVDKIKNIKWLTNLPVAAGFGISSKETVIEVLKIADGFVVGSLFVNAIDSGVKSQSLEILVRTLDPRGNHDFN